MCPRVSCEISKINELTDMTFHGITDLKRRDYGTRAGCCNRKLNMMGSQVMTLTRGGIYDSVVMSQV